MRPDDHERPAELEQGELVRQRRDGTRAEHDPAQQRLVDDRHESRERADGSIRRPS